MKSQTVQILAHLNRGHAITPLVALKRYGCLRLAARIADLRRHHDIRTLIVRKDGKSFAAYRMA